MEALEPRQLLTNIVAVTVNGGAVTLNDVSGNRVSTGDNFDVSYTGTQFVMTGRNGTLFRVNGADQASFTATVTGPLSLSMNLNSHGNSVNLTGNGTANLASLNVNMRGGRDSNTLNLTNVVANSVNVTGGRGSDRVTLTNSTVNNDLKVNLGQQGGDSVKLLTTTVSGDVSVKTLQLIVDHSTISGGLDSVQTGRNANFVTQDSTYSGAFSARMGRDAVITMMGSPDGANQFLGSQTISGPRGHKPTIYQATNAVVNNAAPNLKNINVTVVPVGFTAPTVTSAISATANPKITGTFDTADTNFLSVTANGKTYTLGVDSQLTSPTTGNWSLDLTNTPLTLATNTIVVVASDVIGNNLKATGTVTNQQAIINSYLAANNLTATKSATGLNTVVTTVGTGALPTSGQTLNVSYSGHILNSNGTVGVEFDSNVDPQFNHVTPFTFKLGAGSVIKGWDEGFASLKVGSVAQLIIPSSIAYGTSGSQGTVPIPPNSILIFDVKLNSATTTT